MLAFQVEGLVPTAVAALWHLESTEVLRQSVSELGFIGSSVPHLHTYLC